MALSSASHGIGRQAPFKPSESVALIITGVSRERFASVEGWYRAVGARPRVITGQVALAAEVAVGVRAGAAKSAAVAAAALGAQTGGEADVA